MEVTLIIIWNSSSESPKILIVNRTRNSPQMLNFIKTAQRPLQGEYIQKVGKIFSVGGSIPSPLH